MTAATFDDPAAFADALPPGRALMGLDLGTVTIGLAVSDTNRRIASPLRTIRRTCFPPTPPPCSAWLSSATSAD